MSACVPHTAAVLLKGLRRKGSVAPSSPPTTPTTGHQWGVTAASPHYLLVSQGPTWMPTRGEVVDCLLFPPVPFHVTQMS